MSTNNDIEFLRKLKTKGIDTTLDLNKLSKGLTRSRKIDQKQRR